MTELEVLFLFDEPLRKLEQDKLDYWVRGSPFKPGLWSLWCLSYGPIPANFMEAKAVVTVGAKASRFVMENATLPKRIKSAKLENRAFKVVEISGFGSFKYWLVLKSAGQNAMSARFAEQSGFRVSPAGDRKTIESLWTLKAAMTAKPVTVDHLEGNYGLG